MELSTYLATYQTNTVMSSSGEGDIYSICYLLCLFSEHLIYVYKMATAYVSSFGH